MSKYLIIIEPSSTGFSAYSPDLPGPVATGKTQEETELTMREAIEFHIEGMKAEGYKIPDPSSKSTYIAIAS